MDVRGKVISGRFLPEPTTKAPGQQHDHDVFNDKTTGEIPAGTDELIDILFAAEREDLAALHKFKKKKRKGLNL